ncbi:hypothetical protein ACSQ67_005398 [Phaseolus vulgaris]
MAADTEPKKIIIDTDPGIELPLVSVDDAMAIFVALQSPEIEVIGLTTIYGNVYTTLATRNALHLVRILGLFSKRVCFLCLLLYLHMQLEVAGRTDIPVAEGTHLTLTKGTKLRIADFVHGADGLGNQNFPPPKGKPIEESAASFLVRQAKLNPGKVTVVALGPLTNIALIFGDPDAADVVFTSGADILAVGINVTHQVILTSSDREILASSNGKFAQYLHKILDVYFSYHQESYNTKGVYLHDPTVVLAAVDPSLVTCIEGIVRVQTSGITRGLTLLYNKQKRFGEIHVWSNKPTVKVAVTVDAPRVMKLVMDRLLDS